MLFNSITFGFFLPIVFILYWLIGRKRLNYQNFFLIIASYIFYGWWDWRFLTLIFFSSLVDYIVGGMLFRTEDKVKRKVLLIISLTVNLGILGFFKYFNFFVESFIDFLGIFGLHGDARTLNVILPVGISFYTFQTLSYTLDIYKRKIDATTNPIAFFAFVSFFPQLVAGPIERAASLLPQFLENRNFDVEKAKDGMRQILWGFFKKVVVADNMAKSVSYIFDNHSSLDGLTLILGAFFFAMQIYCDFSGYSDIAIGTARLFGFNLMRNFAYPYLSRDIGEFWRRWHISLSSWFRDYVYIPMGGSRVGKFRRIWNIVVTFTVSGFWHGANFTFIIWGLLNGLYYIPLMLSGKQKVNTNVVAEGKFFPTFKEIWAMFVTFMLALFAWIFFRAMNVQHAVEYIFRIFSKPYLGLDYGQFLEPFLIALLPLIVEWFAREKEHGLEMARFPVPVRWVAYTVVIAFIAVLGSFGSREFIYFQF